MAICFSPTSYFFPMNPANPMTYNWDHLEVQENEIQPYSLIFIYLLQRPRIFLSLDHNFLHFHSMLKSFLGSNSGKVVQCLRVGRDLRLIWWNPISYAGNAYVLDRYYFYLHVRGFAHPLVFLTCFLFRVTTRKWKMLSSTWPYLEPS